LLDNEKQSINYSWCDFDITWILGLGFGCNYDPVVEKREILRLKLFQNLENLGLFGKKVD